ncbi:MAG: bifunctional phosphoribosylaminoimidazolecarboxamide formyltransferase/IMP cyclohydrolase [Polyangiaceae bacterium]
MTIRRALLSVSDKTGLLEFAKALAARDVELLSTGGTFSALADAKIPVRTVESFTGSPEVMDGRVKTLHPKVHGGLLGREGKDDADLSRIGGAYIDLVVVNLYPFEQTLARGNATFEELIEKIDIGGPSMLRSAAKNHERVTVICDPSDYAAVLAEIETHGQTTIETRRKLAGKVYALTAAYDAAISGWFTAQGESDGYPRNLTIALEKAYGLRYGENPHQSGAFYRERSAPAGSLARAESLGTGAKELSYNNLIDTEAALDAVREFTTPAAVVIKHNSPCGAAVAPTLAEAYQLARDADSLSAFGGIVALNREVDDATAQLLVETFLECVVAPGFSPSALERLRTKKALRLLATGEWLAADHKAVQLRRIGGGFVAQQRDATGPGEVKTAKIVTTRAPSENELGALEFAWLVCKHVKSNAIVLARAGGTPGSYVTTGIGGGQTARVTSVNIACEKAGELAGSSVLASDAFFPFPDGVEAAAKHGVLAFAQPGGSKNDEAVIDTSNRLGLSMVFTGNRHFRH